MKRFIFILLFLPSFIYSQDIKKYKVKNKEEYYIEIFEAFKSDKNFKHGKYEKMSFYKSLKEKGFYKNNKKDGEWAYYNNGTLKNKGIYKEGEKIGVWEYYSSGEIVNKYDYSVNKLIFFKPEDKIKLIEYSAIDDTIEIERPPLYLGGSDQLISDINHTIRYPAVARETNIQGEAIISFDLDAQGNSSNYTIVQSLGGGCDEETIRVLKVLADNWIPALTNDNEIDINIHFTMKFQLAD